VHSPGRCSIWGVEGKGSSAWPRCLRLIAETVGQRSPACHAANRGVSIELVYVVAHRSATFVFGALHERQYEAYPYRTDLEQLSATLTFNDTPLSFGRGDASRLLVKYAQWLPQKTSWINLSMDSTLAGASNRISLQPVPGQRLLYAAMELEYDGSQEGLRSYEIEVWSVRASTTWSC